KTSIFSHPVYLFLREFSLQDFRGGSVFRLKKLPRRNSRLSAAGLLGSVSQRMKPCVRQSVSTLSVLRKSCAANGSSAGILSYL
ncbi:hypothetical protein, partial [Escherichia coli]